MLVLQRLLVTIEIYADDRILILILHHKMEKSEDQSARFQDAGCGIPATELAALLRLCFLPIPELVCDPFSC